MKITTKDFNINKTYHYNNIEKFINNCNGFELIEYGENIIGMNFLVIKDTETDGCISFVLTGRSSEYFYKCIYSDFL